MRVPGREAAVLVGVAVDGVGEQVGPDAAVVEQRVALARGAVAHHLLARPARLDEERDEVVAHAGDGLGEPVVALGGVQARLLFGGQHVAHGLARLARDLRRAGPHADRAAVGGQQLDVDQAEPARGERPLAAEHRVVLEVLVVDGVELGVLHQREQVLHLDRHPAVVGDHGPQALGEADDVGDVGVDVVEADQIGRAVLLAHLRAGLRGEERRERGHALVAGGLADVDRRLHTQAADAALDDVLEQVAVVAGHLHHERVGGEAEALDRAVDEPAGVLDPGGGEGGEVGVLGERLLGRDQRGDLGEQAALADAHVQRVGGLRLLDGRGGEEQLARRGGAEVEEAAQLGRAAQPAGDRWERRRPPPRAGSRSRSSCRGSPDRVGGSSRFHREIHSEHAGQCSTQGMAFPQDPGGGHGRRAARARMETYPPWCNGSTSDFGSDGSGSNPGGGAAIWPLTSTDDNSYRSSPGAVRRGSRSASRSAFVIICGAVCPALPTAPSG